MRYRWFGPPKRSWIVEQDGNVPSIPNIEPTWMRLFWCKVNPRRQPVNKEWFPELSPHDFDKLTR